MKTSRFWRDALERAARTFAQGAAGSLATGFLITDWSSLKVAAGAALVGGIGAVLSGGTSILATRRGETTSASLLRQ